MTTLPTGWVTAGLLDIVTLHDSKRVPLNKEQRQAQPGPYAYYGANGLVDYVGDYLFDGEYILIAEDGGYFDVRGKSVAYLAHGKFWVNNHAHIVSPLGAIPNKFLLHWCNHTDWTPFVGGTTRLKLTQEGMRKARVGLPPLPEQKRIVAELDALNEKSARARAELARIETLVTRYKQAVLAKAFSPDACENPAANWRFAKLQELLESGPTNGWSPKAYGEIGALKSLKLSATSSGRLVLNPNTIKYIDQTLPEASKYWLLPDDILIQRANSLELLGTTVLYNGPENAFIYPDLMMRIRADRRLVRPEYLAKYLNARHTREYFRSHATGTAGNMPKINGSVVRQTPVHYPSLEHQDTIIRQVGDQFSKIDRIAAEAKRALELVGKLDEAILAKAFRGELVAQDPNDEPASVLLDRIRAEREAAPKQRSRARAKKSAATE